MYICFYVWMYTYVYVHLRVYIHMYICMCEPLVRPAGNAEQSPSTSMRTPPVRQSKMGPGPPSIKSTQQLLCFGLLFERRGGRGSHMEKSSRYLACSLSLSSRMKRGLQVAWAASMANPEGSKVPQCEVCSASHVAIVILCFFEHFES